MQLNCYGNRGYRRARLTNGATGERQEVELFDINDEKNGSLLFKDSNSELKVDLKAALAGFSLTKRRILFRVLVQGQSVKTATNHMKGSSRTWERWFTDSAMPHIRKCLSDYYANGEVAL